MNIRRILAVQLKRLGDLTLTTPALEAIHQSLPNVKITLALEHSSAGILPAIPHIANSLILRRGHLNGKAWRHVLSGGWDVCLDFTGNDRSSLLAMASRAPKRIAFESVRKSRHRTLCHNTFVDSKVRERHTIDHYLDLLAPLEIRDASRRIALLAPPEAEAGADAILAKAGVVGPFLQFHPGTARREKYWEPWKWAECLDFASTHFKLPVVVTGNGSAEERAHLDAISASARTRWTDLGGVLTLPELVAVVRRAALLLCVDSAPMHLAAACDTPQVALFGPTNPFHWRPLSSFATVVQSGNPEGHFTPRGKGSPMEALSTSEVVHAITSSILPPQAKTSTTHGH